MPPRPGHVTVLGLVGGVAAGKSAVARGLEERGAVRIDADAAAHEVLAEPEVAARLARRLGDGILSPEGTVDRRALGRLVFDDPAALAELEAEVHPRIRRRIEAQLAAAAPGSVVVLDAALLLENGLDAICDLVAMVESAPAERERRARTRRDWPEGEVARRERRQLPPEEKRRRADVTIENHASLADLERELDALWTRLVGIRDESARRSG